MAPCLAALGVGIHTLALLRSETHNVRHSQRPPRAGEVTHSVLVRVDDARAHCEHARAHGARIDMEPTDYEYGERQYRAEDLAGHVWTFSQTLADVAPEEWGGESVG